MTNCSFLLHFDFSIYDFVYYLAIFRVNIFVMLSLLFGKINKTAWQLSKSLKLRLQFQSWASGELTQSLHVHKGKFSWLCWRNDKLNGAPRCGWYKVFKPKSIFQNGHKLSLFWKCSINERLNIQLKKVEKVSRLILHLW